VKSSGLWQRAILEDQVPLITYRTMADVVGAWPELIIVLITICGLGVTIARRTSRAARRRRLS
jgi:hypothetical protein